jgi:hypothetical protein
LAETGTICPDREALQAAGADGPRVSDLQAPLWRRLRSRGHSPPPTSSRSRAHWQIENCLHWVLDVVLDEDLARARKDHAPENLARLRRFALNMLRANQDQGSTRGKIKRAGWDDAFLLKLLATA